jgi:integrase
VTGSALGAATRAHVAAYVRDLTARPSPRGANVRVLDSGAGPANATLQQRLTAVRRYYDYLVEDGRRPDDPVGRGRYTPDKGSGGQRDRGLIPVYRELPWIPSDEEWQTILDAARPEPLCTRVTLAFAYDAALRREEPCALTVGDLDPAHRDPAHRLLCVRAETTKGRRERVVPYSVGTADPYAAYLHHRRDLSRARGPLFLSESRRNRAQPVSLRTWSWRSRRQHSSVGTSA